MELVVEAVDPFRDPPAEYGVDARAIGLEIPGNAGDAPAFEIKPHDAERVETVDGALGDLGLLGPLRGRLAKEHRWPNQFIGVLVEPGQGQAQLRPVVSGLALGQLAVCHAGSLHGRTTRRSRSAQHTDIATILQTCVAPQGSPELLVNHAPI